MLSAAPQKLMWGAGSPLLAPLTSMAAAHGERACSQAFREAIIQMLQDHRQHASEAQLPPESPPPCAVHLTQPHWQARPPQVGLPREGAAPVACQGRCPVAVLAACHMSGGWLWRLQCFEPAKLCQLLTRDVVRNAALAVCSLPPAPAGFWLAATAEHSLRIPQVYESLALLAAASHTGCS